MTGLYAYCTLVPGTMATSRLLFRPILIKHLLRMVKWRSNTLIRQKLLSPSLNYPSTLKIAKLIKRRQRTHKLTKIAKTHKTTRNRAIIKRVQMQQRNKISRSHKQRTKKKLVKRIKKKPRVKPSIIALAKARMRDT